jgi:UDP-N-acetylmuramate--alanine ligase
MEDIEQTFLQFMDRVPFYGMVVGCNDDDLLRPLLARVERRTVTYGLRPDSSFRISQVVTGFAPGAEAASAESSVSAVPLSYFHVHFGPTDLGEFCLQVPGNHNVLNAAAAIAVGIGLDIRPDHIRGALENFRGVDRRFQIKGRARGVTVIDDYGHHPTEIRSTLAAARQCGYRRVHVIFQPHRYTRTRDLMDDFGTALNAADSICVLDIYAASEPPLEGIDAQAVVRRVAAAGGNVSYAASFEEAASAAVQAAQPGDAILTLGAGSISHLGPQLLVLLEDSTSGRVHHTAHF